MAEHVSKLAEFFMSVSQWKNASPSGTLSKGSTIRGNFPVGKTLGYVLCHLFGEEVIRGKVYMDL